MFCSTCITIRRINYKKWTISSVIFILLTSLGRLKIGKKRKRLAGVARTRFGRAVALGLAAAGLAAVQRREHELGLDLNQQGASSLQSGWRTSRRSGAPRLSSSERKAPWPGGHGALANPSSAARGRAQPLVGFSLRLLAAERHWIGSGMSATGQLLLHHLAPQEIADADTVTSMCCREHSGGALQLRLFFHKRLLRIRWPHIAPTCRKVQALRSKYSRLVGRASRQALGVVATLD
jgi:hypothetical protein